VAKVSSERVSSSGSTISRTEEYQVSHVIVGRDSRSGSPRILGCRSFIKAVACKSQVQYTSASFTTQR
jgi:hypothetical protein